MIFLKSLSLSGFKSISAMESPLSFGQLTVMIGANGAGKSNILSFFNLLNHLTRESLQQYIGLNGGPESLLFQGVKTTQRMSATLEFNTKTGINTYAFDLALAISRVETLIFAQETTQFTAFDKAPYPTPFRLGTAHQESALFDPKFENNKTIQFFRNALAGFRFFQFHDTSREGALRRGRCESWNFSPFRADGGNLPAVLLEMHRQHPQSYHLLLASIRLVAPFFRSFVFEEMAGRGADPDIHLTWLGEGSEYRMGLHQLSDGTIRFIALATLLSMPEPLMPKGALLIDEPELGLHPRALGVLASLMRVASERVQIICTTQSPDFLSEFEPSQVVVAERSSGSSVFRRVDEKELKVWLEDEFTLGEIWKKNLIGGRPRRD